MGRPCELCMDINSQPIVKQQMLFHVPVARVFEAFIDPRVTTKFWFTHSDGRLESGRDVNWEWRIYGCSTSVRVLEIETNRRIVIEWGDTGKRSTVRWTFDPRSAETTLVTVENLGFSGSTDEIIMEAIDSMGGFSLVLANAKALLEHDINLNLIRDHAPDAILYNDDPES